MPQMVSKSLLSDGEIITSDDFVQIAEIFLLHEEGVMRASRPMNETKIASKMNKSGSKKNKKNVGSYYFTITKGRLGERKVNEFLWSKISMDSEFQNPRTKYKIMCYLCVAISTTERYNLSLSTEG